ncbi:MAG: hypothetical protein V4580_12900 [Bacteroidota bacterium]
MKILRNIKFDYADVQLLDIGVVRIDMLSNHIIDLEEAVQMNIAQGELLKWEPGLVLMVAGSTTQFTSDARDFSASREGLRFSIAEAMLVKNLAQRIIVSFYLKINKPAKPSKAFNTEEDAINWLLSLKQAKTVETEVLK